MTRSAFGLRSLFDQLVVYGTEDGDTIHLTGNQRIAHGFDGNDQLHGTYGNVLLYGGEGNDGLHSGHGADLLDGGSGFDTANYSSSTSGVTVNLITGTGIGGYAHGDTLVDIESIYGSTHDDLLIGDGGSNYLYGNQGVDQIIAGAGHDYISSGHNAVGEAGDFLSGGSGSDVFDFQDSFDSGGGVAMDYIADFESGIDTIRIESEGTIDQMKFSGEAANFSYAGTEVWYFHTTDATYGDVTVVRAQFKQSDTEYRYVDIMVNDHQELQGSDFYFDLG